MENKEEFKKLLEDYLEKQKIARNYIKRFIVSGYDLDRAKLLSVKPFNEPDYDEYKLLKQAENEAHQKWLEFARK